MGSTDTEMTKPSLDVIASKCNVSKMTVSRVLRNDTGVSEKTRRMVMSVAEELGYFPSTYRKSNRSQEAKQYSVLFQTGYSLKDAFFSDLILSIQKVFFDEGLYCSFGVIKDDYSEFIRLAKMVQSANTAGVLVVGELPIDHMNMLLDRFANIVLVDYPGDARLKKPYNAVVCDQSLGSAMAVNHLISLGRKRILLIHGSPGHYFTKQMLCGYREALSDNGIEYDPCLTMSADFHLKGGQEAMIKVLDAGIEFDAVFSNDEMACGAMNALKAANIKIPSDVSVVGFDGLLIGQAVSPALTTITVNRGLLGSLAVNRLLALENEETSGCRFQKISIFPELVLRQSCGGHKKP